MGAVEKPASTRRALSAQWKALYGKEAPFKIPNSLLALAIAYRIQEKTHRGLKPAVRRRLLGAANLEHGDKLGKRRAKLAVGTILVREWQGVRHAATVLDKGVAFEGKLYRSLTQVAEVITGAHWSGPAFFGLDAKRGARHD